MRSSPLLVALVLIALVAGTRPNIAHAAWPTNPWSGVPLCTAPQGQNTADNMAVTDGQGGAFACWTDYRAAAAPIIYVTRVTAHGDIAPGWPVDGIAACTVPGSRVVTAMVPGTAGDAYILWEDYGAGGGDIVAQHVTANGTIAPGWPANGLALGNDPRLQYQSHACVDGAGGLYAVWQLEYSVTDGDIYMTRVLPNGTFAPGFQVNGIAVAASSQSQSAPDVAADGSGNAWVTFMNSDGTWTHPWVQKIGPAGANAIPGQGRDLATFAAANYGTLHVVPGANGGAIVGVNRISGSAAGDGPVFTFLDAATNTRFISQPAGTPDFDDYLTMVPDRSGGAFLYFRYNDASFTNFYHYLSHLTSSGAMLPELPGAYVFSSNSPVQPTLACGADGAALLGWSAPGGNSDVQMQKLDATGILRWPAPYLVQAAGNQLVASIVPDADGGAIVTYVDARTGAADVYAAKIDRFGYLGESAPAITKISDVPADNGGRVAVQWSASARDVAPGFEVARYSVWRRVPGGTPAARAQGSARTLGMDEARPANAAGWMRVDRSGAQVVGWEYVTDTPARGYAAYSAVLATTSDSSGGGNPRTAFRIEAETSAGIPFWDSAPDSGYSVDNLPPAAPGPFSGTYSAGTATLAWSANTEPDIGGYRLYRGSLPSFVPGPATLVAEQSTTGFVDAAGRPSWYKLAAVDVHGNSSPFTALLPAGTTDASVMLPRELALARPAPNPARDHVDLRFSLPRAANVLLEVFDTSGRRMRTLAEGQWPAGEFSARWDGRNEAGSPAGPGVYFARFTAEGRRLQQRVALLP